MKQARLKIKVLSEVDLAAHFINWDKWLSEEFKQKSSDEWLSVGLYDLNDKNDRTLIRLAKRISTRHLRNCGIVFMISTVEI